MDTVGQNSDQENFRGLLDLDVELSTQDVMAGQEFSMYVLVKNPFDKPIWIRRVHVSVPSEIDLPQWSRREKELEDEEARRNSAIEEEAKRRADIQTMDSQISSIKEQLAKELTPSKAGQLQKKLHDLQTRREELVLLSEEFNRRCATIIATDDSTIRTLNVDTKEPISIETSGAATIRSINIADPNISLARTVDLKGSLPEGAALQPSNTAIYTVIMNTKSFLLFRPSQYRLQFSVNFGFVSDNEDEVFTNTVASTLSIRASIYAVIIGSALGGCFGAIAHLLQAGHLSIQNIAESIVSIFLSIILSVAAVIFLARKAGVQSFVSVEDIWGGMLIGFLVGYSGVSFFQQLTSTGAIGLPTHNQTAT